MKCPRCRHKTCYLRYSRVETHDDFVDLDEKGNLMYEENDAEMQTDGYFCPRCGSYLTDDEDKVKKMLKKKD